MPAPGKGELQPPGGLRRPIVSAPRSTWGFFAGSIDSHQFVQYLRIRDRSWHSVAWEEIDGNRLPLLVNGWILRLFRAHGHPPDFAVVQDDRLKTVPATTVERMLRAYKLPLIRLPLLQDATHVYLDVSKTWFPNRLYSDLAKLSPQREVLRSEDGETAFWQFRKEAWPAARSLLQAYGVSTEVLSDESWRIRREELEEVPVQKVSNLLAGIYTLYLKAEGRINYLRTDLALGDVNPFHEPELDGLWRDLELTIGTNPMVQSACEFIRDYSHRSLDWKEAENLAIDPTLNGLVFSIEKQRFGRKFSGNYLRLYIPNLDTILHLDTTVNPTGDHGRSADPTRLFLNELVLERWRVYPFLGRIKNLGSRDTIHVEMADQGHVAFIRDHMASLAAVERLLAQSRQFSSFNVDRHAWREGHQPFSRTFLGCFKIKIPLDRQHARPSILATDALGTACRLELTFQDMEHRRRFLRAQAPGSWVSAVVSTTLQSATLAGSEPATFFVEPFHRMENLSEREASEASLLGLVKAMRTLPLRSVDLINSSWQAGYDVIDGLRNLERAAKVIRIGELWVYVPSAVQPQSVAEFEGLASGGVHSSDQLFQENRDYARIALHVWSMDRAHPLFWLRHKGMGRVRSLSTYSGGDTLSSIMENGRRTDIETLRPFGGFSSSGLSQSYPIMVSGNSNPTDLLARAAMTFSRDGIVILRAAGSTVELAYRLVRALEHRWAHLFPRTSVSGEWLGGFGRRRVRSINLTVKALAYDLRGQ